MRLGRRDRVLALIGGACLLGGCAAAQVALERKDLEVQTQMSQTIFLQPVSPDKKTVWIEIKNTSDKDLDLSPLPTMIAGRGYRLVQDPTHAYYWLQVNVRYVGSASLSAIRDSLYAGWGGTVAGAATGTMAGVAANSPSGVAIGGLAGGLLGGAAELVAGSLVKTVTYTAITDVQISEPAQPGSVPPPPVPQTTTTTVQAPAPGVVGAPATTTTTVEQTVPPPPGRSAYRTRVASTATKVNLSFDEAKPAITERLLRSLAGIL